jgi:hypothetical protein
MTKLKNLNLTHDHFPPTVTKLIYDLRKILTIHWSSLHQVLRIDRHMAEPVFVNLLRSPGIDSQPGGQVGQPSLSYRPARLHRPGEIDYKDSLPGLLKRL